MYNALQQLMNDSKNKKQAFQEVFKVHIDIYLYNKEKSEYKYQVSSYFNLVKENPKITYKKDIYKRNKVSRVQLSRTN